MSMVQRSMLMSFAQAAESVADGPVELHHAGAHELGGDVGDQLLEVQPLFALLLGALAFGDVEGHAE